MARVIGGVWTDSAVRRYVRDAGDQLARLHVLTRADCTTRDVAKAERLRRAYDDLERRIAELAAQEELNAMRPDLNGSQIMEILGIPQGRDVGRAYAYLLERRIEEGPLGEDRAREELLAGGRISNPEQSPRVAHAKHPPTRPNSRLTRASP